MTPSIDRALHQFLTVTDLHLITEFDVLPNYARFPWNICSGCGMLTENAYSSGHLVLFHFGTCMCSNVDKKGRDLTQSYDKSPYTHRKIQKASLQNTKTSPKTSITQQLRTDLGRSVGVTAVNLTGLVKPVYVRTTFPLTATAM